MGLSIQTEEPAKAKAPNGDREETKSKNKQTNNKVKTKGPSLPQRNQ